VIPIENQKVIRVEQRRLSVPNRPCFFVISATLEVSSRLKGATDETRIEHGNELIKGASKNP
jgi:hypothetical protein